MWSLVYLACLVASVHSAGINLDGVRCGQFTCEFEQYCSSETNQCAECSAVCNKTSHNYDSGICNTLCQGYLLDQRYMLRTNKLTPPSDYNSVHREAQTALIVSCVALALLLIVLIVVCRRSFSWRYIKQKLQPSKNRVKQYPGDLTHHNPHAEMAPKPKHDLKLEIRNPEPPKRGQPLNVRDLGVRTSQTEQSQAATTPKTVSTTISNRHPAEDTTLDYSYDNRALNVTPPEPATHRF